MKYFKMPAILGNVEFLKLWGNQVLLQVGMNMCNYTSLLILADRTHSPFIQAVFYTSLTIPAFVFGLIAGPIVDIVDRKRLMLISDFLLAILFFCYGISQGNVIPIMLIAFATASVARFFIPAEAATIPLIVEEKILEQANTFFLFTLMGSVLLGYTIAGPLIQVSGGLSTNGKYVPYFVAGLMLIIGFLLRLSLKRITHLKPNTPKGTLLTKTLKLFLETVIEVKNNTNISLPLILLIFVELMVGILSIVILEYVQRYLLLPLTSVSYVLMIPLILGLITGVISLSLVERRYGRRKSIIASVALTGLVLFLFGILPLLLKGFSFGTFLFRSTAIIGSYCMGVFVVFIAVQSRTILQLNAKVQMHGRIFSFLDVMIAFVTPMPVLILGLLADRVSLLATLCFIGIGIMCITLLGRWYVLGRKAV